MPKDWFILLNERGREIVTNIQSSYSKAYAIGARIVCRKFANYTDEAVLKYISKLATESRRYEDEVF